MKHCIEREDCYVGHDTGMLLHSAAVEVFTCQRPTMLTRNSVSDCRTIPVGYQGDIGWMNGRTRPQVPLFYHSFISLQNSVYRFWIVIILLPGIIVGADGVMYRAIHISHSWNFLSSFTLILPFISTSFLFVSHIRSFCFPLNSYVHFVSFLSVFISLLLTSISLFLFAISSHVRHYNFAFTVYLIFLSSFLSVYLSFVSL
jgi:hypothetical protein